MNKATARVTPFTLAVALCVAAALFAVRSDAQVLRGIAKTMDAGRPVERAQVMALNMNGKAIGNAITDSDGRFYLRVDSKGSPFVVSVKRIGIEPTSSEQIMLSARDTLDVEFLITEVGIKTDTLKVTARASLNDVRLEEATRRGWRVFSPELIAARRETVNSFSDLIRGLGYPGLIVGNRPGDCIRSSRFNRCLTLVLDGNPMSEGNPLINPRDIYFLAVLSASESANRFGDRAPFGAIVIHTRMNGDKLK